MLRRSSTLGSAAAATVYCKPGLDLALRHPQSAAAAVVGQLRPFGHDADGVGQAGQDGAAQPGDGERRPHPGAQLLVDDAVAGHVGQPGLGEGREPPVLPVVLVEAADPPRPGQLRLHGEQHPVLHLGQRHRLRLLRLLGRVDGRLRERGSRSGPGSTARRSRRPAAAGPAAPGGPRSPAGVARRRRPSENRTASRGRWRKAPARPDRWRPGRSRGRRCRRRPPPAAAAATRRTASSPRWPPRRRRSRRCPAAIRGSPASRRSAPPAGAARHPTTTPATPADRPTPRCRDPTARP